MRKTIALDQNLLVLLCLFWLIAGIGLGMGSAIAVTYYQLEELRRLCERIE